MKRLAIRLRGKSATSRATRQADNPQQNPDKTTGETINQPTWLPADGCQVVADSHLTKAPKHEAQFAGCLPKADRGKVLLREPHVSEDAALFRAAIGKVTPLAEQNRISPPVPSTQARVRTQASHHQIPDTLSDGFPGNSPEEYLGNGLSRLTFRKLRRGSYPVQDNLDLHGYQIDAARQLLQQFLFEAAQHQLRCVLVIHGKGANSPGGEAVLRELTRSWLIQHPQVLAYCKAPANLGGSGAVMILLKAASS